MSPSSSDSDPESSPCIGVCSVNAAGVCVGCFRHVGEIAHWPRASHDQRIEIKRNAERRRLKPENLG